MIRKIRLFVNKQKPDAPKIAEIVKEEFLKNGFIIDRKDFDLGIAIGGDGSFLSMGRTTNFDSKPYYVGINAGTLGFMQEVKPNEINKLIEEILEEKYKTDEIGIQETTILTDDKNYNFYSLNEIIVKEPRDKVINVDVNIDNDLLEKYTGDGLLIASSYGSTAQNLSYNGSIVYPTFSTLQITPMGPVNSKVYRTLPNSIIIPSNSLITLVSNTSRRRYSVNIDGIRRVFNNVNSIETTIKDKKIKVLRFSHYNFPQKISEKLLSN